MKRKVIRQGNNTLTITLPRKWSERAGLRAGDEIDVEERGYSLLVSPEKKPANLRTMMDITHVDRFTIRVLSSLYRKGYDEVEVRFSKPGIVKQIHDIISTSLLGFEIVEQGKDFCLIKNISIPLHSEFDTIMRRTFLLLISMGKDSLDAISKSDLRALEDVRDSETINNKFTSFCRRILNISGYPDFKKTPALYSILEEMEKVADEYRHLCTR